VCLVYSLCTSVFSSSIKFLYYLSKKKNDGYLLNKLGKGKGQQIPKLFFFLINEISLKKEGAKIQAHKHARDCLPFPEGH
jgi:hypothetical protein